MSVVIVVDGCQVGRGLVINHEVFWEMLWKHTDVTTCGEVLALFLCAGGALVESSRPKGGRALWT